MALQSSGTISLQDIQVEFGGSNPISISEYYGSDSVPSSGTISLSDFHGTSNLRPMKYSGSSILTFEYTEGKYGPHGLEVSGTSWRYKNTYSNLGPWRSLTSVAYSGSSIVELGTANYDYGYVVSGNTKRAYWRNNTSGSVSFDSSGYLSGYTAGESSSVYNILETSGGKVRAGYKNSRNGLLYGPYISIIPQ